MSGDLVEIESSEDFAATLARVTSAIESHGMSIFARIDHAAGARSVGLSMPETIVLFYGNPKGGTPIMLEKPQAALDLPLRVLLREENGKVFVAFHPAATMLAWAGVPQAMAAKLAPAQQVIVDALKT